jgi:hypothetical protein
MPGLIVAKLRVMVSVDRPPVPSGFRRVPRLVQGPTQWRRRPRGTPLPIGHLAEHSVGADLFDDPGAHEEVVRLALRRAMVKRPPSAASSSISSRRPMTAVVSML